MGRGAECPAPIRKFVSGAKFTDVRPDTNYTTPGQTLWSGAVYPSLSADGAKPFT